MTKQWKLKSALVAGVAALATTAVDAKQYSVAAAGREACRRRTRRAATDRSSLPATARPTRVQVEQLVELEFEFVQQFELEFVLQQLVELELQFFEQLQLEFFVERLRPRLAPSPLGADEKGGGRIIRPPSFAEKEEDV